MSSSVSHFNSVQRLNNRIIFTYKKFIVSFFVISAVDVHPYHVHPRGLLV